MRKIMAYMLMIGFASVLVSGCKTAEKAEEPSVEEHPAAEALAAEHPEAAKAPKDHPAH